MMFLVLHQNTKTFVTSGQSTWFPRLCYEWTRRPRQYPVSQAEAVTALLDGH